MRKWLMVALMIITFVTAEAAFAFTVSSPFGWRINPISHRCEFHPGIDIPSKYGVPVLALFNGVVVWAGLYGGYGNTVILQHRSQAFTLYGHCARVMVQRGQTVHAGQQIGIVGSTGYSTGSHLHLEYWINNQYVDPMLIWKKDQSHLAKRRPAAGKR
jgi:murein DD-endopeptidase MepM/ murein hydrolase activator NlpD